MDTDLDAPPRGPDLGSLARAVETMGLALGRVLDVLEVHTEKLSVIEAELTRPVGPSEATQLLKAITELLREQSGTLMAIGVHLGAVGEDDGAGLDDEPDED